MQKNMPKLGAVLMSTVIVAWLVAFVPPAFAEKAQVAQTGQSTSFAEGDDGDIQAGVSFPTPRFKDNKNGTVTDKLTGLIWLKDASCLLGTWANALAAVDAFNELVDPLEKLSTLLALVPTLDDAATPRGQLITFLYIVRDDHEEITETIDLHAREGGSR
jgi:hypothetical protein